MTRTQPTRSTRDWLREHNARNAELRAWLKANGCRTKRQRKEAYDRGATGKLVRTE